MLWLNPAALLALVVVVGPIVVHVLVRQRATRVPFPTLRFIRPHPLASIRRRSLDEVVLLVVRGAVLAAAVAAVAGPLLITASRRRAWDRQTVAATVDGIDLRQGLSRATAFLERQPPARREIIVRSTFPLGSLDASDVAAVPAGVGLRFERTGPLPASRLFRANPVIDGDRVVEREGTLEQRWTSVRDVSPGTSAAVSLPLDVVAPSDAEPAARALLSELRRERIFAADHRAVLVFDRATIQTAPIASGWMAAAAAQIARDCADIEFTFAAAQDRLVVSTAMSPADERALRVARSVARALAPPTERPADEVLTIPDAQLNAWSRAPGPGSPRIESVDVDDRRWMWGAVLVLLAVEAIIRRRRRDGISRDEASIAA